MPAPDPGSADSRNTFEDLSGVPASCSGNPYDALIHTSANEPVGSSDNRVLYNLCII